MSKRLLILINLAVLLMLFAWAEPVWGAASPWAENGDTRVRLVSAVQATGKGEVLLLGLHFELEDDWKVYWRSPGDAGFPPSSDWAGSENVKAVEILWPAPERFSILGIDTLGYKHEVVLPLRVKPAVPGRAVRLKGVVDYLACSNICVPMKAEVALVLPQGAAGSAPEAHLISRYLGSVPGDGVAVGLDIVSIEAASGNLLRSRIASAVPLTAPDMFVEGLPSVHFGTPLVRPLADGKGAVLDLDVDGAAELEGGLTGQVLTLTLVDGGRAMEARMTVAPASGAPVPGPAAAGGGRTETSLALILLMALLGGLILNLMPCVLPVISIKTIGVIKHGGGDPHVVRLSFLLSAAGILFAFLLLAGALVALKAGGAAVGWGIQFQHSWFLVGLILVVVLFACNLWGFFEIRLPAWVSDVDEHASHVHGFGGHFLSGMLATLLATPCTAPFLGTAVGFALARDAMDIFLVFGVLGVGMSVPYLFVAAAPKTATCLPKPGPWMVVLKKVMAIALAATALWLLSVLWIQAGAVASGVVGALMVVVALTLFVRHRVTGTIGGTGWAIIGVLALVSLIAPGRIDNATLVSSLARDDSALKDVWQPFAPGAIPGLVAKGKVVFVDVTAEWCITCLVNKALVLTKGAVLEMLRGSDVVVMQADWTRPDPAIAAYLERFGRYGIPFDAVYGPKIPQGEALPELLTPAIVLDALARAAGKAVKN